MHLRDLGFILPFGLALLPTGAVALIAAGWPASPLWRRVMDPRAVRARGAHADFGSA